MKKHELSTTKRVFNLIIVDESGSMHVIRRQAFSGMNETIETIRKMQRKYPEQEQRITLVTFSSDHTRVHYDNVPAMHVDELHWSEYNPCGCTPLYDAMGAAISKLNAQVKEDDHVLVTVITDGEENSSHEWTLKMIRQMIEKLKEQRWTFTLIGTEDLDVETMARSFAIDEHMKFQQTESGTKEMFAREQRCRERYNFCLSKNVNMSVGSFFDE